MVHFSTGRLVHISTGSDNSETVDTESLQLRAICLVLEPWSYRSRKTSRIFFMSDLLLGNFCLQAQVGPKAEWSRRTPKLRRKPTHHVFDIHWNRCSISIGMGVRSKLESVFDFRWNAHLSALDWNGCPLIIGTRVRFGWNAQNSQDIEPSSPKKRDRCPLKTQFASTLARERSIPHLWNAGSGKRENGLKNYDRFAAES